MPTEKMLETIAEKQSITKNNIPNFLMGLLTLICVGCFSFLWRISEDMAVLKDHDVLRSAANDRLQSDVNQLRSEVENVSTNSTLLKQTVDEIKANQKTK